MDGEKRERVREREVITFVSFGESNGWRDRESDAGMEKAISRKMERMVKRWRK